MLDTDVEPALWSPEWLVRFTLSPAFAGMAALLGALATVLVTLARNRLNRMLAAVTREHALEDRAEDRWWSTFEWTYDRLDAIDPTAAGRLLHTLAESAVADMALSAIDVVVPRDGPVRSGPADVVAAGGHTDRRRRGRLTRSPSTLPNRIHHVAGRRTIGTAPPRPVRTGRARSYSGHDTATRGRGST